MKEKELWQKGNDFGPASYTPTCMATPGDRASENDAFTTLLVYWHRDALYKINELIASGQLPAFDDITTMEDMEDPIWEVGTEESSWGAIKQLYK